LAKIQDLFSSSQGKRNGQAQTIAASLPTSEQAAHSIRHLAIIMDGNGRWATKRHLPRLAGHKAGVTALRRVVECATDENIEMLSVYAFSTENWGRPRTEVDGLMRLFWETIRSDLEKLHRDGVRLRHLGRLQDLSPDIQKAVRDSVELTRNNTRIGLNVCFNYGGQIEITDAVKKIVQSGVASDDITPELIEENLYQPGIPALDLIVRSSGEHRLSNFMLWRSAYAELLFLDKLWPDMTKDDVTDILKEYSTRARRFGG
jgi:undecaprenyl diphosphate synthase